MKARLLGPCVGVVLAGPALAQTYSTVPNAFASTSGGTVFFGPTHPTPRTYQTLIHQSQLTEHVGRTITGVAWRLPGFEFNAWPTYTETFPHYDIRLSPSVAPANRNLVFASNVVGSQTLVRSGPLQVNPLAYMVNGSPRPWGTMVEFQTGYPYTGGHLLLELRHEGFTGQTGYIVGVDAINTVGGPPNVYGEQVSACWDDSYQGLAGFEASFSVVRLRSGAVTVSFAGRVTFSDRVGNVPTSIDIEFKNPDYSVAHTAANVTVDANGDFVTTDLPPTSGNYFASIQVSPWLRKTTGPWNTGSNVSGTTFVLINGDCDGDNEIGIGDYAVLSAAYGSTPVDPNWSATADLDGDDEVSIGDYAILSSNYGLMGDS